MMSNPFPYPQDIYTLYQHANAVRLGKIVRKPYGELYEGLETEFYLSPLSDESGIRTDALKTNRQAIVSLLLHHPL